MAKNNKDNDAAENGAAVIPQEEVQSVGNATTDAKSAPAHAAGDEPEYSAADLASAARARFGVPPEVVHTALKVEGKDKATLSEAKRIVKAFLERKVK